MHAACMYINEYVVLFVLTLRDDCLLPMSFFIVRSPTLLFDVRHSGEHINHRYASKHPLRSSTKHGI